ncbi:PREDICTED: putative pumilio homolog 7, chloroplastic isoform X2 [Lupinus angustifolius]|uniref:putative pumilio homolog 7, chloroplastic isoform X2 n=1 Tax=Lupinus angustifolius TaxID=3871 RepID=UPI00092F5EB7|nr:PREDICTED: putative pumilio homolog 7, chloroplastic isoform X2 [Lupinus angustifolius]
MFTLPHQNADNAMRNDDELRMWLNLFPNQPPYLINLYRDHVASFTSPESAFMNPFSLYGDKSPFECSSTFHNRNVHFQSQSSSDDLRLCEFFSGMNIRNDHEPESGNDSTMGYNNMSSLTFPCSSNPNIRSFIKQETTNPFQHFDNEATPDTKGSTFVPPFENHGRTPCYGEFQLHNPNPSFATTSYPCDDFLCSQSLDADWNVNSPFAFSPNMQQNLGLNLNTQRARATPNIDLSQVRNGEDPLAFNCDNSFILQGEDVKYCVHNACMCKNNSCNEVGIQQKVPQFIPNVPVSHENSSKSTLGSVIHESLLHKFYSLADTQGFIYVLAKDQNGCRFLQKLLDVCREDQRLQIVIMLTREPGQLVTTSMNTHGTRVVQKLIETLKTKTQVSLLRSAIQPGFVDLIKDLNGNHVIQRCLQCLSCQDNEFIFDAATKFCVDIATHQHGCCVLQRCIDSSLGKYRDKLMTEICRHALLLAQDPYGNYVITHIIEMKIPSVSAKLISRFKGNYVYLSMQKFSSHVVESCLKHVAESTARIVRELLSATHFEQLLQDPYANYVVQRALGVTKGPLHASLVEAVRPHKFLRNSPYCKRIFSGGLLKK